LKKNVENGKKRLRMHNEMKQRAAEKAFEILLEKAKGPFKLGLGSGSTSEIFLKILIKRQKELPPFECVASSIKIYEMSAEALPYMKEDAFETLDFYIDGADEVSLDHNFHMIKGGGGCLTREKILFTSAKYRIIMVDLTKLHRGPIGSGFKKIPIEVLPFGLRSTLRQVHYKGTIRRNFTTDQGAVLFDMDAPLAGQKSTPEVCSDLSKIPGVIEVGVFPPPQLFVVGKQDSAEVIHV
jgi:ribose 5-phosphate isomerase A